MNVSYLCRAMEHASCSSIATYPIETIVGKIPHDNSKPFVTITIQVQTPRLVSQDREYEGGGRNSGLVVPPTTALGCRPVYTGDEL